MGEVIYTTEMKREQGFLYYCSSNDNGFITVCRAIACRGRVGRNKKE